MHTCSCCRDRAGTDWSAGRSFGWDTYKVGTDFGRAVRQVSQLVCCNHSTNNRGQSLSGFPPRLFIDRAQLIYIVYGDMSHSQSRCTSLSAPTARGPII